MRRFILIIICIVFMLCPMPVREDASFAQTRTFRVSLTPEYFDCLGPGDFLHPVFYIKNNRNREIFIRLDEVRNLKDSDLYDVLQVKWKASTFQGYGRFDDLLTGWKSVPPKSTIDMPLDIYFPKELGNAYQDKRLNVEFVFVCKGETDEAVWIDVNKKAPETGDENALLFYLLIFNLAVFVLWRECDEK